MASPDLPEQALVNILRRVPRCQRLSSAALVNTAWAAAASAATVSVVIPADNFSSSAVESLNEWLEQHAGHVRSITVREHEKRSSTALLLPCESLTRLTTLHKCKLKLDLGQGSAAHTAQLPALRTLALNTVNISSRRLSILLLPNLIKLELTDTPFRQDSSEQRKGRDAALQQLSSLQHLQSFSLGGGADLRPSVLSGLCSRLSSFSFTPEKCKFVFTVVTVPETGWPLLQQLRLRNTPLQPALLAGLTTLEQLELMSCKLLPVQVNIGPGPQRDAAGASELLAALAHLTRLRCLELYETNLQAIEDAQQANHAAQLAANPHMGMLNHNINFHDQFSSLTASSRLENLALVYRDERVRRLPLPRHTDFDVIFRPGEELVHLAELVIDALDLNALEALADVDSGDDDSDGDFEGQRYDPYIDHGCMCCMDLKNIANCCPNLQHLTLSSVLACEHPQDMTVDYPCALRKLQRHLNLESLCLGGPWLSTASAAAVASMTTLQRLELYNAPNLRANGLEQLTTLRQLKWLEARGVGCVRQVDLCLMSTAPAGSPPNVWRQLSREVRDIRAMQREHGVEGLLGRGSPCRFGRRPFNQ